MIIVEIRQKTEKQTLNLHILVTDKRQKQRTDN